MTPKKKARQLRIKTEVLKNRCGECKICGYKKSYSALCFHHKNPELKCFNMSGNNLIKFPRVILEVEADKCDIYCLNCHAELHNQEGWVLEDCKTTPK